MAKIPGIKRLLHLDGDQVNHVCLIYSTLDREKVKQFRHLLKKYNIKVFDPELEPNQGQSVFNKYQIGIETSKYTIVFLSRNFMKDPLLKYICDMAVYRFAKSRTHQRVIPIILDAIVIPRYVAALRCVAAWKFYKLVHEQEWCSDTYCQSLSAILVNLWKAFIGMFDQWIIILIVELIYSLTLILKLHICNLSLIWLIKLCFVNPVMCHICNVRHSQTIM